MPVGTVIKWDGAAGILQCDDQQIPDVPFYAHAIDNQGIAVGKLYRFKIRVRERRKQAQDLEEIWRVSQHGDEMSVIHTGLICKWIPERGFGFAENPEGDVFLHVRDLMDAGLGEPTAGDTLKFTIVVDPQGRRRARPIEYVE